MSIYKADRSAELQIARLTPRPLKLIVQFVDRRAVAETVGSTSARNRLDIPHCFASTRRNLQTVQGERLSPKRIRQVGTRFSEAPAPVREAGRRALQGIEGSAPERLLGSVRSEWCQSPGRQLTATTL